MTSMPTPMTQQAHGEMAEIASSKDEGERKEDQQLISTSTDSHSDSRSDSPCDDASVVCSSDDRRAKHR